MKIRNYLPIFKYFFRILYIKVIKKQHVYAIGHYHKKRAIQLVLSSKYSVLQVNCVYKQLAYLHRSLVEKVKVKVTQVTKNIYIVDFQRFPVSLTKYVSS